MQKSSRLLRLIILSLLGTISLLLFFLNFPIPFLPTYLKIDFSEVPALIAALIFSPLAGVMVEAIKNMLYLVVSGAGDPIGVMANFFAGVLFIVPISMVYHKYKGVRSIVSGLVTGTIIMTIGMGILNYFVILPLYAWFIGAPEMAESTAKWIAVVAGVVPFSIVKGIVIGMLFVPLFIKMRRWIEQKRAELTVK